MSAATQTEVTTATQGGRARMAVSDSWVLTRRNLVTSPEPDLLVFATISR
jgi:hypothetical protein